MQVKRKVIYSGLFVMGCLCGALFHLAFESKPNSSKINKIKKDGRAQLSRDISQSRTFGLDSTSDLRDNPDLKNAQILQLQSRIDLSREEVAVRNSLAYGEGLASLLDVLGNPQSRSFKLIRSGFIQSIPNYSKAVLPAMKEKALQETLSKFVISDWERWPTQRTLGEDYGDGLGGVKSAPIKSSARVYVDAIASLNSELGRFLETTCIIFHRLYVATVQGQPYELKHDFELIISNVNQLLPARSTDTMPPKFLLSYTVPTDPSFLETFERERCLLVAMYARSHPNDLEDNIRLLASLDGRYSVRESNQQLQLNLLKLSKEATPRLRSQIIESMVDSGEFDEFFLADPAVKRSAAQLLVVSAVDSLEKRDLIRSKRLLSNSLTLYPGLESQAMIMDFYREFGLGWIAPSHSFHGPLPPAASVSEESAPIKFSTLAVVIALATLISALLTYEFIRRKLKEVKIFVQPFGPEKKSLLPAVIPNVSGEKFSSDQTERSPTVLIEDLPEEEIILNEELQQEENDVADSDLLEKPKDEQPIRRKIVNFSRK